MLGRVHVRVGVMYGVMVQSEVHGSSFGKQMIIKKLKKRKRKKKRYYVWEAGNEFENKKYQKKLYYLLGDKCGRLYMVVCLID